MRKVFLNVRWIISSSSWCYCSLTFKVVCSTMDIMRIWLLTYLTRNLNWYIYNQWQSWMFCVLDFGCNATSPGIRTSQWCKFSITRLLSRLNLTVESPPGGQKWHHNVCLQCIRYGGFVNYYSRTCSKGHLQWRANLLCKATFTKNHLC